jgi:predicted metal-binding membrane protein
MTQMAASMVAMMLPTAAPFLVAYGRSSRRAGPTAIVTAIYVAVWAAIGVAAFLVMSQVMLPSGLWVAAAAILFAALYALAPWSRRGRARCREMCLEPAGEPVRTGLAYSARCIACSAGVMVAVVILGMSNLALMAAAAAVVLLLKWPPRSTSRPGSLSPEGDVAVSP